MIEELKKSFQGEILTDTATLTRYSHDASLFEVMPSVVAIPRDVADVK